VNGGASWRQGAAGGVLTAVETLWLQVKAWRLVRQGRPAMRDSLFNKQPIRPANDREPEYAPLAFMPLQSPVLTLARLLGRQIAREEFERGLTAINDNARPEIGEG